LDASLLAVNRRIINHDWNTFEHMWALLNTSVSLVNFSSASYLRKTQ
jgi:hypothetical protein